MTDGPLRRSVRSIVIVTLVLSANFLYAANQNASPSRSSRNVILITLDTVRADRVGAYGARPLATPVVDGLASDGVLFERAISQVPSDLAFSCRDFYRALSVSEWGAGLHRATARCAVSHGCAGISKKGVSHRGRHQFVCARSELGSRPAGLIFMMTCFLAMLTRIASWGWSSGRLGRVSIMRLRG